MKTKLSVLVLALVVTMVTGCATRYSLVLTNGDVITSKGRPHLDKQKNRWFYTDASGHQADVSALRVREVTPESMRDAGGTKFISQPSR